MKIDWNRKYTTIAVYTVLTAFAIILLLTAVMYFPVIGAGIKKLNSILAPVWIGLIIAYLANPILKFCEKHIVRFKVTTVRQKNLKRGLSMVLTFIIILIILTVLLLLIIPQVYLSFADLSSKMGGYISSTTKLINDFSQKLDALFADSAFSELLGSDVNTVSDFFEKYINLELLSSKLQELIADLTTAAKDYVPQMMNLFSGIASGFLNVVIGICFSIYFLAAKEKLIAQLKKLLRALTSSSMYNSILELCNFTDKTFGGFITGEILDSLIVGLLCFAVCAILQMPYSVLVGSIVGITNIIPVAGPFIGAIPSFLIIFIVDPIKAFWFAVIILIIQQLDGNVIKPKIVGQTTGLASVWVLFSITVMGGLMGLLGMVIAVPLFSVLYSLLKIAVEKRLSKRQLPTTTLEYYTGVEDRTLTDDDSHTLAAKLAGLTAGLSSNPIGEKFKKLADRFKKKDKKKKNDGEEGEN